MLRGFIVALHDLMVAVRDFSLPSPGIRWSKVTMSAPRQLSSCARGTRQMLPAAAAQPVHNPATGEVLARVPLSPPAEVDRVARAAEAAYPASRRTPPAERIQLLFRM